MKDKESNCEPDENKIKNCEPDAAMTVMILGSMNLIKLPIVYSDIQEENEGDPRCTHYCFNASDSPRF